MPLSSIRAFVLDDCPLNEQDKLVSLLSQEGEIIKAIAPGSLKNRNRFGSVFELFSEGDFFYYWKENNELVTISRGEVVTSFYHLISQPENIFYFCFMAEILLKFIPHGRAEQRLFRLIKAVLLSRQNGVRIDWLLVYFMVWVLRIEGMMFNPRLCHNCQSVDPDSVWVRKDFKGTLCRNCHTDEPWSLVQPDIQFILWIQKHSPERLADQSLMVDIPRLLRFFKAKIEYHGDITFRSSQYINELK